MLDAPLAIDWVECDRVDPAYWHPMLRRVFDYWSGIAPPGRLPGRQHLDPLDIPDVLSRLWLADAFRDPWRFRYRLIGTAVVRTQQTDFTGRWLDEAHPGFVPGSPIWERWRHVAATGKPTWRRGPVHFPIPEPPAALENLVLPLAGDGRTVDRLFGCTVYLRSDGRLW